MLYSPNPDLNPRPDPNPNTHPNPHTHPYFSPPHCPPTTVFGLLRWHVRRHCRCCRMPPVWCRGVFRDLGRLSMRQVLTRHLLDRGRCKLHHLRSGKCLIRWPCLRQLQGRRVHPDEWQRRVPALRDRDRTSLHLKRGFGHVQPLPRRVVHGYRRNLYKLPRRVRRRSDLCAGHHTKHPCDQTWLLSYHF